MIFATSLSPVLAYLTPTAGFMYALIIMFAFNIWAGMRADGVSVCLLYPSDGADEEDRWEFSGGTEL